MANADKVVALRTPWGRRLRIVGTITAAAELIEKGADMEDRFNPQRANDLRRMSSLLIEYAEKIVEDARRG